MKVGDFVKVSFFHLLVTSDVRRLKHLRVFIDHSTLKPRKIGMMRSISHCHFTIIIAAAYR